ncbi:MAG: hypothetical protein QF819_09820 [Gemmatimonadota bacterium]|nr:hypothetical protein [Gemmatimonadota bacterium]MDP6803449.1 hypothetical protein [Gemmatimonadota bacterium]MDP7031454.1 hypothetical protein [Gemmatimonadota bacterium]
MTRPTRAVLRARLLTAVLVIAATGLPARAKPLTTLATPGHHDLNIRGSLFQSGIPATPGSISPDGYHLAHLFRIPGGLLKRKPRRCAFLLDLSTGENREIQTPQGNATRISGWDTTGRYLLVESTEPDLMSSLTGGVTTFHWIYDVVTSDFIPRKPFTGIRDGNRFQWKKRGTYHGVWRPGHPSRVWALYERGLPTVYRAWEEQLKAEDQRRAFLATQLAVGRNAEDPTRLADVLKRLDNRWTRRGHKDPIVSELFGERPTLFARAGSDWVPVFEEVEFVSVLDRGLALVTLEGGQQALLHVDRGEILPLPTPPDRFAEQLRTRWDRGSGFFDENDPLPRDMQYRRDCEPLMGLCRYFRFVTPDVSRLLVLYSFGPQEKMLRILDLPESWRKTASAKAG